MLVYVTEQNFAMYQNRMRKEIDELKREIAELKKNETKDENKEETKTKVKGK